MKDKINKNNPKFKGKISEGMFRWSASRPLDSKCYLRLYFNHGRIYALVQQLPGFNGCSIVNGAEDIAKDVLQLCREDLGLKSVNNLKFLQFIPKEANTAWEDEYSLVHFDWNGKWFSNPRTHHLSYEMVWRLLGERPPKSLLQDKPETFTEEERQRIYGFLSICLKEEDVPERVKASDPSEFYLFRQDRDGYYVLINHKAGVTLYITMGGELFKVFEKDKIHSSQP